MAAATSRQTLARPLRSNKPPPGEDPAESRSIAQLGADLRPIIVRFRTCHKPRPREHYASAMPRTVTIVGYRKHGRRSSVARRRASRGARRPAALRIDHIGSTAVPGLPAKDVIDVQVTVAAGGRAARCRPSGGALARRPSAARLRGRAGRARQALLPGPAPARADVHVREGGRLNQRYPLLCRDYLRADPAAAAAYAAVKRPLAARFADDRDPTRTSRSPSRYRCRPRSAGQGALHRRVGGRGGGSARR